jgi:hypothetical protein
MWVVFGSVWNSSVKLTRACFSSLCVQMPKLNLCKEGERTGRRCEVSRVFFSGDTAPLVASGSGSLQKYTNQRSSLPTFGRQKEKTQLITVNNLHIMEFTLWNSHYGIQLF